MNVLDLDFVAMTKKFAKTPQAKEIMDMYALCFKASYEKENKQHKFRKGKKLINIKSGEILPFVYDFAKEQKVYFQSIKQKVFAIEQLAQDHELVPIFITYTLPSHFHIAKSRKYKSIRKLSRVNENFLFDSLEEAIRSGYIYLQQVFRVFYKRVKDYEKNLLYVKVFEPHKTLVPHMHVLFFVMPENVTKVEKTFRKIVLEFDLQQTKYDACEFVKNIKRATKYLLKYLQKNQNEKIDYSADVYFRILDGWKRLFKIRLITSTNLPLSLTAYRKIYKLLDNEAIGKVRQICISKNISIFYELYRNIYIHKTIKARDSPTKIKINEFGEKNAKYKLYIVSEKYKAMGRKITRYRLDDLQFYINEALVASIEKFSIIHTKE